MAEEEQAQAQLPSTATSCHAQGVHRLFRHRENSRHGKNPPRRSHGMEGFRPLCLVDVDWSNAHAVQPVKHVRNNAARTGCALDRRPDGRRDVRHVTCPCPVPYPHFLVPDPALTVLDVSRATTHAGRGVPSAGRDVASMASPESGPSRWHVIPSRMKASLTAAATVVAPPKAAASAGALATTAVATHTGQMALTLSLGWRDRVEGRSCCRCCCFCGRLAMVCPGGIRCMRRGEEEDTREQGSPDVSSPVARARARARRAWE